MTQTRSANPPAPPLAPEMNSVPHDGFSHPKPSTLSFLCLLTVQPTTDSPAGSVSTQPHFSPFPRLLCGVASVVAHGATSASRLFKKDSSELKNFSIAVATQLATFVERSSVDFVCVYELSGGNDRVLIDWSTDWLIYWALFPCSSVSSFCTNVNTKAI